MDVRSCEEWAEMTRYVPSPYHMVMPGCTVVCRSKVIVSYSFFRHDILPEWEDPKNVAGHTLTARLRGGKNELQRVWETVTCDCARGYLAEHVNGVQFSKRYDHKQPLMKIDLWLPSTSDVSFVTSAFPAVHFVRTKRKI